MSEYGTHQLTIASTGEYSFAICNPCGWSAGEGRRDQGKALEDFRHHVSSSPLATRSGQAGSRTKEFAFNPQIRAHLLLRAAAQFCELRPTDLVRATGAEKTRARRMCIYVLNQYFEITLTTIAQMLDLSVGHAGNIKNGVSKKLRTSPDLGQEIERMYRYMVEILGGLVKNAEEA